MAGHQSIPPYRRPAPGSYDPLQHDSSAQLAPEAGMREEDMLLRQRLASEVGQRIPPELALQQWHHQQQIPQPVHQQHQHQQYHHTMQHQQPQLHHHTHHHQQQQVMAPPPTPQAQYAAPPPPSPQPTAQAPAQSPPSEAPTPKTIRNSRPKAKQAARKLGRRKSSVVIKEDSDGSISEEFTMEGVKTKSGRKVHRPAHFNPAQKTPSRRRGPYRRNYDARICKVCQRGHSPQSNMIVFCDGCNTPYHQLCHDPPIDELVIQVESAEWFCAGCAKSREQRPLTMGLTGVTLTEEEKRMYLASLPMSSLVELIFFAEKTHPNLPLYDPQTKELVAAQKVASAARIKDATPGTNEDAPGDPEDAIGPNWEEMIVRAIITLDTGRGVQPKYIFEWISTNFPALEGRDVRAEAQGSLQAALRKDRLLREGHAYRLNPAFVSSPSTLIPKQQLEPGHLAPGAGIKLPLETEEDGAGSMLVDDDLIAFSHQFTVTPGEKQATVEDMMEGIVRNGLSESIPAQSEVTAQ
ncbi:hypothetical protein BDD12DRAFT_812619 [Trichophaea hybrida]|nr:hypothetical protein BDD12DRAFT_812619 [Trichophaea hybrida]